MTRSPYYTACMYHDGRINVTNWPTRYVAEYTCDMLRLRGKFADVVFAPGMSPEVIEMEMRAKWEGREAA